MADVHLLLIAITPNSGRPIILIEMPISVNMAHLEKANMLIYPKDFLWIMKARHTMKTI
jgi:hypothetical protein